MSAVKMIRSRRLRALALAVASVVVALAFPATAHAEAVSSIQLVETPTAYDGRTVTFSGEAIGEVMVRGGMAWLHLNDDAYAQRTVDEGAPLEGYNSGQAVVVPSRLAEAVAVFGDSTHRGDIVEVTGVFNAACTEHGGDMDIHATTLQVVSPGARIDHPVTRARLVMLGALTVLASLAAVVTSRRSRAD